jgi:hypothetical protein
MSISSAITRRVPTGFRLIVELARRHAKPLGILETKTDTSKTFGKGLAESERKCSRRFLITFASANALIAVNLTL